MLTLPSQAALWFLLPVAIVSFVAAFNDLKRMKLPNPLVLALGAIYVVMGPFLLPFDHYLWGFAHAAVIYVVALFAFAYLGVGAGDGKFAEVQATAEGAAYDEEELLRLLRLARIGCAKIFAAQDVATGR